MVKSRIIAVILFLVVCGTLSAQYNLHIQVNDFSRTTRQSFLAGNFNNWTPGDYRYKLTRVNYFRTEITLYDLPAGWYEFKLNLGSDESVETKSNGADISNRVVHLQSDTTVLIDVKSWKDLDRDPAHFNDSIRLQQALSKGFSFLYTNLDSSFKYALETYDLANKQSSPRMKSYAINLQGEVLLRLGNFQKALELYEEGLKIRTTLKDSSSIVYLYNQVGNVYWQMKDSINAVKNYRLAIPWFQSLLDMHPLHENKCNIFCNIGRYFLGQHHLDSAKWYAARAGEVGDKISTLVDMFLGDIERYQNNTQPALAYYRSAVNLGLYHDHNKDLVLQSYQTLAEIFDSIHQADSAIYYGRKAFETALSLQNADAERRSGILIAGLFKQRQEFDSAFLYQQKLIESAQYQFNQEKERQTLNTYFTGKLNEQQLTAQKKQHETRLWLYAVLSGLAVLMAFAFWYNSKTKSAFSKKMKEIEMRALRAQMNPHFIFNCLGSINRYIVKSDTKTASQYLTKFSKLIRLILDNSSTDHVSLEAEIQTLQLYLDMESLRFDHAFEYEIQQDDDLDKSMVQLPSMLIQPYVENAIWHGLLQKEEKGKLWIRFKKMNEHLMQVEIEDSGIGRTKAAELKSKEMIKHKSYGMQISSERIQIINYLYQLKNSVSIHDLTDEKGNASGTKIIVQIPVV